MNETALQEFEVKKPNGSEAMVQQPPMTMMEAVQGAILRGDLNIETLERLLNFQRELKKDQAKEAFVAAMNAFKRNPPVVLKNAVAKIRSKKGDSSSFSYNYAPLDTVCKAVVSALSEHGLSHRWVIDDSQENVIRVTCVVTHELGHSEETSMRGPVQLSDFINALQSRAVTVSYLERYTLMAAAGLAATLNDTDGREPAEEDHKPDVERLSDERYLQLRDGIENAGDKAELERLYHAALKAAGEDEDSKRDFSKAKNKCYRRLSDAGR